MLMTSLDYNVLPKVSTLRERIYFQMSEFMKREPKLNKVELLPLIISQLPCTDFAMLHIP